MTRLDSPLQRADSCSMMETHSRSSSRRGSRCTESRKEREQASTRSFVKRANRFLSLDRETQDGVSPPVRHYERGHPLPSNCSPERKATIPFRNPDLGLPSHRRHNDALSNEATSGLSPQRYMPYSNFRRGDSQSRTSPRSGSPRSTNISPQRQIESSRSSSHRRGSTSKHHGASYVSSRQASRKCSPSRRRDSVVSRTHSPSQTSVSNKYAESGHSHKRSPSQSSYGHSLDSEKLYRNLKSIASSAESDDSQQERSWSKRSRSNMDIDGHCYKNGQSRRNSGCNSRKSGHNTGSNSRDFSPPGSDYDNRNHFSQKGSSHANGYNRRNSGSNTGHNTGRNTGCNSRNSSPVHRDYDKNGHSSPRNKKQGHYGTDKLTVTSSKSSTSERHSRTDFNQSQGSWHGSSHSLRSPASPEQSRNISPSRRSPREMPSMIQAVTMETDKQSNDRSRSTIRRGLEALILSENTRSTSQPAVPEMTIEDYVVIADIPRVNLYPEEDGFVVRRRPQSRSPRRDDQRREGRDGDGGHGEQQERGRGRERGRDRRERDRRHQDRDTGGSSETNSNVSDPTQLDSLDCKKGWMHMLDSNEEWKKFWFVLDSFGLKYYTDPEASEMHEPGGLIDVRYSVRVVEFDADKNYGFQIQMRDGDVTLSAMTSRIRKNWVDILRHHIRSADSPSVKQHPDGGSGSEKENSLSQNASCRFSPSYAGQHDSRSEVTSPCQDEPDTSSPLTNQREAGVGRDKDYERRLEDRTKWFQEGNTDRDSESPWDKVQLKKSMVASVVHIMPQIPETFIGSDIEKRWEDFENIPLEEMKLMESETPQETNELLQREVLSLRQQIEDLRKGRVATDFPCGPGAPCMSRLEQIEKEHREKLQELEREHERERREMQRQREQLLRQEAQHSMQVMHALKKAHEEERERLQAGEQTAFTSLPPESAGLQRELEGLSERYSRTCVELREAQQATGHRRALMHEKEREVEELRRENQELQVCLSEEMSLMRSFITGQSTDVVSLGSFEQSNSELEILLRMKKNEIECLHKEISCLRDEIQSLTKEKQELSEHYKEVYVELSSVKGFSEREITSLKEHLRLTNVALDEERLLGNSTNQ